MGYRCFRRPIPFVVSRSSLVAGRFCQNPGIIRLLQKQHVIIRIRADLRCIEPEGGETERSLSESGHNTSFRKNVMFSFELELISIVSNPKGGNRVLSIRIGAK